MEKKPYFLFFLVMNKNKKGPSALCGVKTTAESLFLI